MISEQAAVVRVWDLPTRLFHWALLACVIGSLVSINIGGNAVGWHFRFGYAILTLLLFRVAWGFVGPRHARFSSFPPNPAAAWRYLRRREPHLVGHSPLGALSVYALLLALTVQVVTGLFANDAIMWDGPLRSLVSNSTSDQLTAVHQFNRLVVIGLVLLHVAAIAYYRFVRREALVGPMLTGDREIPGATEDDSAGDAARERLLGLVLFVASAAIVWAVVTKLPG
ncbi:MAG TPA: cytochrome b/b6 domain-containing protein [Burkholderiaceae bacterium]|nr:cytochrome b/b6 domain-containing protein [Burkholderiaceae bacterium]